MIHLNLCLPLLSMDHLYIQMSRSLIFFGCIISMLAIDLDIIININSPIAYVQSFMFTIANGMGLFNGSIQHIT